MTPSSLSLFPDTSAAAYVLSQCLAEIQNWTPYFKVNLNKMEAKLIISWQKITTAPSATM